MKQRFLALARQHHHFVRYSIIGFSGVGIDFVVFLILFNLLGIDAIIANVVSTSCGIVNNFFLNRHLNFNKTDFLLLRFVSFYAAGMVGIILSTLMLRIFHDYAHLDANLVKILSIIVVVITQYLLNKKISFRDFTSSGTSSHQIIGGFISRYRLEITLIIFTVVMFVVFIPKSMLGVDESDNFLSAKLILSGQLPHVDFFSHHMPTAYFISTIFYILANGDVLGFRIVFTVFILAWLLANFWLLHKYVGRVSALTYLLLMAVAHGALLQYMMLSEAFITYATTTVVIAVLCLPDKKLRSKKWIATIGLLAAALPLLAISYIYVAVLLYTVTAVRLFRVGGWPRLWWYALFGITPYIAFVIYLVASGSYQSFVYQNLTFNAQFYGPFFGDMGTSPVLVGINIIKTSLGQIWNVLTGAGSHLLQLTLLIGYLLLPAGLWLNKKRGAALAAVGILLLANPRVGLFGPPAIETSFLQSTSQHAELYRGLSIVFASLSLAFLLPRTLLSKKQTLRKPTLIVAVLIIPVIVVYTLSASLREVPHNLLSRTTWTASTRPNESVRIINTVAGPGDKAWSGPLDFLGQSFMKADRATSYTFFLPWHHYCTKCHTDFYRQLSTDRPLVISWSDGFAASTKETPRFDSDMHAFLDTNYFKAKSPDPVFSNLYFRDDKREAIIKLLKEAGYEVR